MNCQTFKENLNKYLDGELEKRNVGPFKFHLSSCALCGLLLEKEQKFEATLRHHMVKESAPYALRESVVNCLEGKKRFAFLQNISWLMHGWRPVAVTMITLVLVFSVFLQNTIAFPLFEESITRHVQCLAGAYPIEISSEDIKEVSKWFVGKLDFAVKIPDLTRHGIKLKGARLCHLKDKKVALIYYDKDGHRISVFVLDSQGLKVPRSKKIKHTQQTLFVNNDKGYQSILCLDQRLEGVGCIFVSDLPEEELIDLIIS